MINRRHIRLKVMQSLYAYFTSNNKDLEKAQKQMLKECENIATLYLLILSLPYILAQFSKVFLEEQKKLCQFTQSHCIKIIRFKIAYKNRDI